MMRGEVMTDVAIQKVLLNTEVDLDEPAESGRKSTKLLKFIKISFPHIALGIALLGYLFAGALTFQILEREDDWEVQKLKAEKIRKIYGEYADTLQGNCNLDPNDPTWRNKIYRELEKLSSQHENRPFKMDHTGTMSLDEIVPRRWSNQQAVLYALSILSTTGYSYIMPTTIGGQIFAMVYGLIGIPLMVLCAVDIGRFFSDVVLGIYSSCAAKYNSIKEYIHRQKTKHIVTSSELLAKRKRSKSELKRMSNASDSIEHHPLKKKRASIVSLVSKHSSKKSSPAKIKKKVETKKPPIWAIFGILLLFLTLGGIAYIFYSVNDPWTAFVQGVFNAFNLIANLTMGEETGEYDSFTVCYIVFFVTFGLAVLTMCADLAASHLKWLFMKIHYFGRQIQRRRKRTSPEVKELLEIIKEIRLQDPDKQTITFQDILNYMEEHGNSLASGRRRNTIAYQPNLLDTIKFADDEEGGANIRNRSPSKGDAEMDRELAMAFSQLQKGVDADSFSED